MFLLPLAWCFSWSGSFLLLFWLLCIALWFFLLLVGFFRCLELTNLIAFLIVLAAGLLFFVLWHCLIYLCCVVNVFSIGAMVGSSLLVLLVPAFSTFFILFLILQFLLYCVYVVIVLFLAYVFFSPLRLISFSLCYVSFVFVGSSTACCCCSWGVGE